MAARAETFTFVTTGKAIDNVYLPPASPSGRPEGAQVFAATSVTTYADGKKQTSNGKCSARILPVGSTFGTSGVCAYTESGGPLYAVQYSCEMPERGGPGVNCWGKLIGQGGAWKCRTGTLAFFNGAGGSSKGAGQWN